MGNEIINIAVWGIGNHAKKNLLPAISSSNKYNLYGVLTRDRNTIEDIIREYKCCSWDSSEAMLADSNLDVVFLSTPPALHFNQGMNILQANKHLYCEKPLTTDIDFAHQLISFAEERGLAVFEALMYQYHPHFLKLKNMVINEEILNIQSISSNFGLPTLDKPGYRDKKELGASCLLDVGIYPISLIYNLFHHMKIDVINTTRKLDKHNAFDVSGSAHLLLDSKINCNLQWSYNSSYRNEIDIWGENIGLYSYKIFSKENDYTPSLEIRDSNGNISSRVIDSANHYQLMIDYFAEIISNETKYKGLHHETLGLSKLIHQIQEK